ncbi:MAG: ketopantoate reductase family protein [Gemmatimonadales bacterium]
MKHAILGAGGIGGFVGAILGNAGADVTVLLRPESFAAHPDSLELTSPLGNVSARVQRATTLDHEVDVLWIATKATQLESALRAVPGPSLARVGVPLLNGIDHVALLRMRLKGVEIVPGTIGAEAERTAPGKIAHLSPFARFGFAGQGRDVLERPAHTLERFGCTVSWVVDEATLLWRKLVMLAPFALTTSALGKSIGGVRDDPRWLERLLGAAEEACAVALADGAGVDAATVTESLKSFPAAMKSSMQKDLEAGRPPELDAIAGPIIRGGARHGIDVPYTTGLAVELAKRVA